MRPARTGLAHHPDSMGRDDEILARFHRMIPMRGLRAGMRVPIHILQMARDIGVIHHQCLARAGRRAQRMGRAISSRQALTRSRRGLDMRTFPEGRPRWWPWPGVCRERGPVVMRRDAHHRFAHQRDSLPPHRMRTPMNAAPILPTTVVGSYPQPAWLFHVRTPCARASSPPACAHPKCGAWRRSC